MENTPQKMYAKKSLGQNFLHSKGIVKHMAESAQIQTGDIVLEIGPGKGILTETLLETGAHVIAVEKDDRMIPFLEERFVKEIGNGSLTLLHKDILETDMRELGLVNRNYKLAANIPYYITGEILRKFLEAEIQPKTMVLMVQKEVARRIVASDKKESILSISVKVYGTPHYIKTVEARHFKPEPSVDSAILLIEAISKENFKMLSEEKFFAVLKAGFAHKRKVLAGNLGATAPKENIVSVFEKLGINPKARAEDIALPLWLVLAKEL